MTYMVHVYGFENCDKCERSKDKLKILGVKYQDHLLGDYTTFHDGWRDDFSVELTAAHEVFGHASIPLIRIGSDVMESPMAMKRIKQELQTA